MGNYKGYFVGLLWFVAVSVALLFAGLQIGQAVAYSDRQTHIERMECLDRGGELRYVTNIGTVCDKDN